jgi:hypothetical protein
MAGNPKRGKGGRGPVTSDKQTAVDSGLTNKCPDCGALHREGCSIITKQTSKGGGDRWVTMATAMTNALERMRIMYELISHLKELHEKTGGPFSASGNWTPLLNETAEVANILKTGLKAR